MKKNSKWTWSDGWILMAAYMAQGDEGEGARLCDLIAMADGINHAIPTARELSNAFTKLSHAGVLSQVDDRYLLNPDLLPSIKSAYEGRGGLFESANKGEKWLSSIDLPADAQSEIVVREEEVTVAYDEYIATLERRRN